MSLFRLLPSVNVEATHHSCESTESDINELPQISQGVHDNLLTYDYSLTLHDFPYILSPNGNLETCVTWQAWS